MNIAKAKYLTVSAGLVLGLTASGGAQAHGVLEPGMNSWAAWNLTPDIVLGTLIAAGLYARGLARRRLKTDRVSGWRHVSFFAGLAAIFLALQSPIDAIAERVFLMHQVQHVLLRMIGPMLLFLAAPQGLLVAGTPGWAQRGIVAPILSSSVFRTVLGVLAHPAAVTALFIGTLYFWQIPKYHDMALLNDYVHYLMHASMLVPGLLFFWRVFDARPAPQGTGYGVRLMMLWVMILSNIVIGSYLAFKKSVLYSAYEQLGRIWDLPALQDELFGGAFIWIPSSMMGVVAALIVIHKWGRQETKDDNRRTARLARHGNALNEFPETATDLIARAAPKNRIMAFGFATFVLFVFAAAILVGAIGQML